jgi:hypothetical protein
MKYLTFVLLSLAACLVLARAQFVPTIFNAGAGSAPTFTLLTHTAGGASAGGNTGTSSAENTTGAHLSTVCTSWFTGGTDPVVIDSVGNTYTEIGPLTNDTIAVSFWYKVGTVTTNAAHTVTMTGAGSFFAYSWQTYSGSSAAALDANNSANSGGTTVTSQATGNLTPAAINEAVLACLAVSNAAIDTYTISGTGFTTIDDQVTSVANEEIASSHLIQTSIALAGPTFAWTVPRESYGFIVAFHP